MTILKLLKKKIIRERGSKLTWDLFSKEIKGCYRATKNENEI